MTAAVPILLGGGKLRSVKWGSWRDALVGGICADEAKVSLVASAQIAADGFGVCFAFALEFGETRVSGVADDLRQRRMLEEGFSVVDLTRHCVVYSDNSVSSVTRMNRVIKMSLLEL